MKNMKNRAIFGTDKLQFTRKNTEILYFLQCTIGSLIVSNGINICIGTINEESLHSITKTNLWEYLVYIFDNNKAPGQKFSNIKCKPKFLEYVLTNIIDFLTVSALGKLNKNFGLKM